MFHIFQFPSFVQFSFTVYPYLGPEGGGGALSGSVEVDDDGGELGGGGDVSMGWTEGEGVEVEEEGGAAES